MLKQLSLVIFLLANFFQCFGQFQFRAPESYLHYRIDFSTSTLFKENKNGEWLIQGKLEIKDVIQKDIPLNLTINAFDYNKSILLTISGTGQVYSLDQNKMLFKRLDKTFYRGYNFQAIQYVRNDTLFSHGGMGFWHANNVTSYFSFVQKEWEMLSAPAENSPRWLKSDFGGYDSERKVLSVIEFPSLYDSHNQTKGCKYFEKSLLSNEWKSLGDINVKLLHELGITRLESVFLQGKYFFLNGPILVWADPSVNKIYQVNSPTPTFNLNFEFVHRQGIFYSYRRKVTPVYLDDSIQIDSISLKKLILNSTSKGVFYSNSQSLDLWIYGGMILIVLIACFFYFLIMKKTIPSNRNIEEPLDGLPAGASAFLLACLEYPKGQTFSSQHFTEIMGYDTYAYETQRQVRAKLIKGINSYFWAHYRLDEVIIRQTANDDKRFSVYLIAESHYDTLKKLLNS
jgi:hypothetical protein